MVFFSRCWQILLSAAQTSYFYKATLPNTLWVSVTRKCDSLCSLSHFCKFREVLMRSLQRSNSCVLPDQGQMLSGLTIVAGVWIQTRCLLAQSFLQGFKSWSSARGRHSFYGRAGVEIRLVDIPSAEVNRYNTLAEPAPDLQLV